MPRLEPHFPFPLAQALLLVAVATATATLDAGAAQPADWNPQDQWTGEQEPAQASARRRFYASAGFGFDFSQGDYGEADRIDSWSVPGFVKLEYEPFTFKLMVPYVAIDGSEGFVAGESAGASTGNSVRRFGIGDVVTTLTYTWYPDRKYVPLVDLSTKIKIPTASRSKGLGTGKADVTFQVDVSQMFGSASVFAGGGYRIKGGFYDDIWLASLGSSVRLGRRVSVGIAYDYRQASTPTSGDSHELSPFASFRLGSRLRASPYVVIGLSRNSPDWGSGATIRYNF